MNNAAKSDGEACKDIRAGWIDPLPMKRPATITACCKHKGSCKGGNDVGFFAKDVVNLECGCRRGYIPRLGANNSA